MLYDYFFVKYIDSLIPLYAVYVASKCCYSWVVFLIGDFMGLSSLPLGTLSFIILLQAAIIILGTVFGKYVRCFLLVCAQPCSALGGQMRC